MKIGIMKRALSMILSVCMLFSSLTFTAFASSSEWTPKEKTKVFVDSDSIADFDNLKYEANFFREEYEAKLGVSLNVTIGTLAEAGASDVILTYDGEVPPQGYKVSVNGDQLTIAASDDDGIFYGWHYVIKQMVMNKTVAAIEDTPDVAERSISLDNGRKYYTVDWIKELIREMSWSGMNTLVMHFSEEMGLGLETKTYSWLNGRDGRLCTQATLSENFDDRCLTQDELREIAAYAKAYHVELVPSLDSPGHMNYIVYMFNLQAREEGGFTFTYDGKTYNTVYADSTYKGYLVEGETKTLLFTSQYGIGNYYSYSGKTAVVAGSSVPKDTFAMSQSRGIDITNEIAVAFTKSLLAEYGELFREVGSTKIDIGGDELLGWGGAAVSTSTASRWKQLDHWKAYAQKVTGNTNAVAYDAFILYMNDLNAFSREMGYTSVRMWNDDALRTSDTGWSSTSGATQLDKDIDIWYWSPNTSKATEYINAGYELYNLYNQYCYFAMTEGYVNGTSYPNANAKTIFSSWTPFVFDTNLTNTDYANAVLGGAYGVWCDNPSIWDEDEVMDIILPNFRAIAAKAWDITDTDYSGFTSFWNTFGAAADIDVTAIDSTVPDPAALRAAVKDAETVNAADYSEASYNAYMEAVAAGQDVLDYGASSQQVITDAVGAIQNAKAALTTDVEALKAAVAESDGITAGMYSEASYAAYVEAVEAARTVLADPNATQSDIQAAYVALVTAKANLSADKSALRNAVDQAPSLDTVDTTRYEQYALDKYTAALADAQAVLADPKATQKEVDNALEAYIYAKGYIFVDYTALKAAVAKADKIEANKHLYVPVYYEDYMSLVEQAKVNYLGEDAYPFHQSYVDSMTDTLNACYSNLVNKYTVAKMTSSLQKQLDNFYNIDVPAHEKDPYALEAWIILVSAVRSAERLLASGSYEQKDIDSLTVSIMLIRSDMNRLDYKESSFTEYRRDLLNSAGLRSNTIQSGSTTRMTVTTRRADQIELIQVVNHEGAAVPVTITVAPANRRQPTIKTLYVDFLVDLEPGTYTFTVYAFDPNPPAENERLMYCGDPITVTFTVE